MFHVNHIWCNAGVGDNQKHTKRLNCNRMNSMFMWEIVHLLLFFVVRFSTFRSEIDCIFFPCVCVVGCVCNKSRIFRFFLVCNFHFGAMQSYFTYGWMVKVIGILRIYQLCQPSLSAEDIHNFESLVSISAPCVHSFFTRFAVCVLSIMMYAACINA